METIAVTDPDSDRAVTLSVADRLEILDVIARADEAASRRDADGYVALFALDAILDGAQGRHAGREEIRSSVGPIWAAEGPASLHLTIRPVIDPGPGGDQAIARSVLMIVRPGSPPVIGGVAEITQELQRTGTGWLITRRTVG
jgi:hypothetical protein